jgi:hypothetical protein
MSKSEVKTKKQIQETEDRLVNRILINFGIGILGYIFLWVLWKANISTHLVLIAAAIFFVLAIACFVVGRLKNKAYIPYGIMFAAFTAASLVIKSSFVVSKIIGMEKFMQIMQSSQTAVRLLNAKNDITFVAACGGVYLAVMLIVNIVLLIKSKK